MEILLKVFLFLSSFFLLLNADEWQCTVLSNQGTSQLTLIASKEKIIIHHDDEGIKTEYHNPRETKEGILQYDSIEYKGIGLDLAFITKNKLEIAFYINNDISAGGNCYRNKKTSNINFKK